MHHPATTGILNLWMHSPKAMRGFGDTTTPAAPPTDPATPPDYNDLATRCIMSGGAWNDYTRACAFPQDISSPQLSTWAYVASGLGTLAIIGGFVWYVSKHNG